MEQNIFEEFQAKKARLIETAAQAKANGWIDEAREKEIVDMISNDTLTLGVIGQMKCGKSTFLNAFVFGDTVLPSATTPMTAALSVITYGPEKKLEAEFYKKDEWDGLKEKSQKNLEDYRGNEMEESKIKAAKELVAKAQNIPGNIDDFLGQTKTDTLDNIQEYVGADGKYIAITKSVKIYVPLEYLKGVEIVDTPGFNDPIVSREERTKEFLRKADVVLLMLYAGRAFDSTDRTILFKNVRECGIGKILIGVNKYDIPYGNGEFEDRIISVVKEQIEKACASFGDESMVALVKENDPILLSAEMSLMAQLPRDRVLSEFKTSWDNACDNFEISTQVDSYSQALMAEKSRIKFLIDAIKNVIRRDKEEILLRKPYNAIRGAALSQKENIESELEQTRMLIGNLSQPDDELEERQFKLERAARKLNRKLETLGHDIALKYSGIIRKGRNALEDDVQRACKKLGDKVDNLKRLEDKNAIDPAWNSTLHILYDYTLKKTVEDIVDEAKRELNGSIGKFCEETEDVLLRFVDDFEARDFMKRVERSISDELDDRDIYITNKPEKSDTDEEISFLEAVGIILWMPFKGADYVGDKLYRLAFGNRDEKNELHQEIEKIRTSFNADDFLDKLKERKDSILELVRKKVIDDLIDPLQKQLEEILSNTQDKEHKLTEARQKEDELQTSLRKVISAFETVFGDHSFLSH